MSIPSEVERVDDSFNILGCAEAGECSCVGGVIRTAEGSDGFSKDFQLKEKTLFFRGSRRDSKTEGVGDFDAGAASKGDVVVVRVEGTVPKTSNCDCKPLGASLSETLGDLMSCCCCRFCCLLLILLLTG